MLNFHFKKSREGVWVRIHTDHYKYCSQQAEQLIEKRDAG
ncbi:hypothetical protein QY97_02636 [Bacillus thermotolerans]|nr:hypothetical protein QY97_02636 [Bacillus thermotolerans]